jgi:hypothetical protein
MDWGGKRVVLREGGFPARLIEGTRIVAVAMR